VAMADDVKGVELDFGEVDILLYLFISCCIVGNATVYIF